MIKELRKAFVGVGLAVGLAVAGYYLFVRECNVIIPPGLNEKRCKCAGKVINLKLLLGDERAMELPKTEHCVGVVVKRM